MSDWWKNFLSGEIPIHHNLSKEKLIEKCIQNRIAHLAPDGVLKYELDSEEKIIEKYFVKDNLSEVEMNWNDENVKISLSLFEEIKNRIITRFHMIKPELYILEASVGYGHENNLKLNFITSSSLHALFVKNITFKDVEIGDLGSFTIYHDADSTFIDDSVLNGKEINLAFCNETKEVIIVGAKSLTYIEVAFHVLLHQVLLKRNFFPIKTSAVIKSNEGAFVFLDNSKNWQILNFTNPHNFKLGSFAFHKDGLYELRVGQLINVSEMTEPLCSNLFRSCNFFGNIVEINKSRVLLTNVSCSLDCEVSNLKKIIFLTSDTTGVFPLISRLNSTQFMEVFLLSFLTSKDNDDSSCFLIKLNFYMSLWKNIFSTHDYSFWVINTGFFGRKSEIGIRYDQNFINLCIDFITKSKDVSFWREAIFSFEIPSIVEGLKPTYLDPSNLWKSKAEYLKQAKKVKGQRDKIFSQFLKEARNDVSTQVYSSML